jgi:superfamily II DNA or RNA helicase
VLRPYQRQQLAEVSTALHSGLRRILVQLATGGGKTHELAAIALAASLAGLRVLILATRTRLVRQIHERLEAFGVAHGVIAAEMPGLLDRFQPVQVASADTLYRRCLGDGHTPLPAADVVIFDEAHLATAGSRMAILEQYPQAVHLGFTATPARKSGTSLSAAFERLILGPTILDLILAGMLVRARIFNVPVVTSEELKALPKDAANDYAVGALGGLLSRPKLVGDVVQNWLQIASGKRTIVFACSKAHGAQLVEEFTRAGVAAELLTDQDDDTAREAVIARLESGQTRIIVNCFLMAYGVDLPTVECIVLARPTRSLVMYLQMVGRGLRPAPGKDHCILIDHGRVVENLGLPTGDFGWSLDERRNVNREALEKHTRAAVTEKPRTCPECHHMWLVSEMGNACQACGWTPTVAAKPVVVQHAQLGELEDDAAPAVSPYSPDVRQFFREAIGWYAQRWVDRWNAKPKSGRWWAWVKTRERFGLDESTRMPSGLWEIAEATPTAATDGWLKSRHIRDCRSRRRAA